jgi:hypothetical protein
MNGALVVETKEARGARPAPARPILRKEKECVIEKLMTLEIFLVTLM